MKSTRVVNKRETKKKTKEIQLQQRKKSFMKHPTLRGTGTEFC